MADNDNTEIVDEAVSIIREKLNLSEEKYVHAESSSFVSDPNSIRQILHIDFKTENTYYIFVALQDVTTENGPTILIPRTASDELYKKYHDFSLMSGFMGFAIFGLLLSYLSIYVDYQPKFMDYFFCSIIGMIIGQMYFYKKFYE